MWPGGVTSLPLNVAPKPRCKRPGNKESVRLKQSLKPKPVINKHTSDKKQRRISSYFTRSSTTSLSNEQLTKMVIELQRGMKQLHQLIKRKKKRSHGRQSSFHTLLNRGKKPDTPQNTDNPEPSSRNDRPNDQVLLIWSLSLIQWTIIRFNQRLPKSLFDQNFFFWTLGRSCKGYRWVSAKAVPYQSIWSSAWSLSSPWCSSKGSGTIWLY